MAKLTNEQKFRTAEERVKAFDSPLCQRRGRCGMILEINDVDFEFLKQVLFKARASLISIGESETYSEDYRRYHREKAKMCDSAVEILDKAKKKGDSNAND